MNAFKLCTLALAMMLVSATAPGASADDKGYHICKNGDFEKEGSFGGAAEWTRGDPGLVQFETEKVTVNGEEQTNRFCRMDLPEAKAAIIKQQIPLDASWKTLTFAVRIRAENVKTGKEGWMTGQFQYLFFDKDDKQVGGWQRLKIEGDTDGWKTLEQKNLAIPDGAVKIKAQIGVWGATGKFDFDDVRVIAPNRPARPSTKVPEPFQPAGPITRQAYYVSPDGDDAHDGRSVDTPFRTIQKAADVMHAGDTCHIRAGVYRESIRPANSGQPGAPITFKPYQNEQVTLSGAEPITGWKKHEGRIHRADMPGDFFVSPFNQADQVFVDGTMMILAQWPNTTLDVSQPIKAVCNKFISKTRQGNVTTGVMEDEDLKELEDGALNGATVFFQPNFGGWSWALGGTVTDHQGPRITFQTYSNSGKDFQRHVYADRSRYIVYGKRNLLDAPGEWFHDKQAGALYLWLPDGSDPAEAEVQAKARDWAFVLDDRAYIHIENLHLFACGITTDTAAGGHGRGWDEKGNVIYPWRPKNTFALAHHVTLDGLHARYLSHFTDRSGHFFMQWGQGTGIVLSGLDHQLTNSVLQFSAGNGVSVLGARHRVHNNLILDTAYSGVDTHAISFTNTATSVDCVVSHNTVRRTGRSGIQITGMKNSDPTKALVSRVHHNDIADFGIQDWDLGAIRATGNGQFTRIDHNLCHNAWPNVDNIPDVGNFTAGGIYLDYGSNWIVDHNVTWDVEWACHLQAADTKNTDGNILVYNNTFGCRPFGDPPPVYGPTGVWVNNPKAQHPGSVVRNNIIFCPVVTKHFRPLPEEPRRRKQWEQANNLAWRGEAEAETRPHFADLAAGRLWLTDDSPAIDAGKPIGAYDRDGVEIPPFNGRIVGQPDLGAYEHGVDPWTAGCNLPEAP